MIKHVIEVAEKGKDWLKWISNIEVFMGTEADGKISLGVLVDMLALTPL